MGPETRVKEISHDIKDEAYHFITRRVESKATATVPNDCPFYSVNCTSRVGVAVTNVARHIKCTRDAGPPVSRLRATMRPCAPAACPCGRYCAGARRAPSLRPIRE
ncbi:hypothetical protein EVAR_28069_1 [Eumeta japonica]|uniref:Uncharacterized protein n=1 Tax=Eumeta variegata TaxID=151549 RepID=A0A4C1W591_EUMVA|nr:hypothetical protein EVAR_28069_1 [Eumeta japonica]